MPIKSFNGDFLAMLLVYLVFLFSLLGRISIGDRLSVDGRLILFGLV